MSKKDVKLPEIGEGVTEGELVQWLVAVGDAVEEDQPVAEVMTDKATVEVPSPFKGKVLELKQKPGDIVAVESVLLVLEAGSEDVTSAAPKASPSKETQPASQASTPPAEAAALRPATPAPGSSGAGVDIYPPAADISVLATPSTRRLARELKVDINEVSGSGLAGRVTREDVLGRAKGTSPSSTPSGAPSLQIPRTSIPVASGDLEERIPLRGVRKKIAENMQMSKHIVPHFTLMDEANVTALVKSREELKDFAKANDVKITYMPFVMKALIATIREFPQFNASIDDQNQEIVYKKYFNIGFAADTPNGLLVPVLKNADQKSILDMSREIVTLATKARQGKLQLDEMRGATFTVTNIGSVGGSYATPIINHPEVFIFGMYKIQERPVWQDGSWVPQKFMNFTVTCDHRLIDGAVAARFLSAFINRIESPGRMMLDMM